MPPLSEQDLQAARQRATAARRHRAAAKERLRSGEVQLGEILDVAKDDDVLAQTRVLDLLKSIPKVGEVKARAVMERLDIAENRRLRGLGRHQVAGLKEAFGGR
ncbi:integration host factor, actinobacterial type [Propionibacteriaceae bacterium Y1685]|uniref:integration host factor, actinobacterial type n=1 Tax=Microlunatus sp. Y1700 TaxID=3418487 RepID=UPI003B7CB7F7